jgi:purine-binding chemotaxis protein CheW
MSGRSHFLDEEQALVSYFSQMLSDPSEAEEQDQAAPHPAESVQAAPEQGAVQAPEEPSLQPQLQPQPEEQPEERSVAEREQPSLESLLEKVGEATETAVQTETATETAAETAVETATETSAETETATETAAETATETAAETAVETEPAVETAVAEAAVETEPAVETAASEAVEETAAEPAVETAAEVKEEAAVRTAAEEAADQAMIAAADAQEQAVAAAAPAEAAQAAAQAVETPAVQTAAAEQEANAAPDPLEWRNIDLPEEFQALFFLVKGVRFAVPLVELGGIFETPKLTKLFGKPVWYKGMADIRGRKVNVVDTLRWVKPDVDFESDYAYLIMLGKSLWSIGCDTLEGNRVIRRENVNWRTHAGSRPWLAGIVKKEMCALIHVKALTVMFERGMGMLPPAPQPEEEAQPAEAD